MAAILWKYIEKDKACASHNSIRNAHINFIFDIAIDQGGRSLSI